MGRLSTTECTYLPTSPWMLLLGVEPDTRTPTEARAATTEARSMLIVVRQKIPVYEEN